MAGQHAASLHATAPRVLSIQSHTVHGYVGNKSAVFPLQTLGIDVDIINSVQFSNHTGYPSWTGKSQVMSGEDLWDLVEGLKANALIKHSHLLTGYMRSPDLLQTVLRTLDEIRRVNPDAIYVCDPVMGDHGKLYVPEDLVPIYRNEVVPRATVLTPNQFEAELLTDVRIRSLRDALAASDALHAKGVRCVVITSMHVPGDDDAIHLVASRVHPDRATERLHISIPRIQASFTGTGDLTAALILAWFQHTDDLAAVIENAVATVQAVLERTRADGLGNELRLIQSREEIIKPVVPDWLRARPVPPGDAPEV